MKRFLKIGLTSLVLISLSNIAQSADAETIDGDYLCKVTRSDGEVADFIYKIFGNKMSEKLVGLPNPFGTYTEIYKSASGDENTFKVFYKETGVITLTAINGSPSRLHLNGNSIYPRRYAKQRSYYGSCTKI